MDVAYFLKKRTSFIRRFYSLSCAPYIEIKRQIEAEEPPYEPPYFDPDCDDPGEPAFLEEWLDADMACRVVGLAAVSMLSETLKIYFQTFQQEYGFEPTEESKRKLFKDGFVAAYKTMLAVVLDTDWSDCPVDFGILEQVVLARNRAQHAGDIFGFDVPHDAATFKKYPQPLFVSEARRDATEGVSDVDGGWFSPNVEVHETALFSAIEEVERLAVWIAEREYKARQWNWRQRQSKA